MALQKALDSDLPSLAALLILEMLCASSTDNSDAGLNTKCFARFDKRLFYDISTLFLLFQEDNSLKLEDKCKWGESFIFVYDVTDKYSFDELTRLKFIASYTHSRMRVNFKPCWILVGNKTDLAEHDRLVSTEEGMALARDLGCHMFREISVKESINDPSDIFEDLWREFSRLSPRSPSTSQRRKFSCRIQDKISVLDSEACACASEALKSLAHGHNHHHHANEALVTTLTSTLKRQSSSPLILYPHSRLFKLPLRKNSSLDLEPKRRIPSIPETDEESLPKSPESEKSPNLRASVFEKRGQLQRRKAFSSENISIISPGSFTPPDREHSVLSSTSSSNASLNSVADATARLREAHDLTGRLRSSSDGSSVKRKNSKESNNLTILYRQHCLRHRNRKWDLQNCNQQFSHTFNGPPSIAGAYEVRGF